jgi:hypothetical protein
MLASLLLTGPALTFHFFAVVVVVVAAFCVIAWMLQKASVAPPLSYVVYAVIALVALWLLFWLLGNV